ncbi:MAG: lysyl oxidase family protein [Actinomycetota bacterium]
MNKPIAASLSLLATLLALAGCQTVGERAAVSAHFPVYANGGKPDLTVDPDRLKARMGIAEREFAAGSCALEEGAVGAAGSRRLLTFDTVIMNAGDGDLVVGDRSDPNNLYAQLFEYAPCHGHYHISDFSRYELLKADDRSVVVAGHKLGFCFRDNLPYAGTASNGYLCSNQGITSGWGDLYDGKLDGQWIDITGVPEGDYIVRVTINTSGSFDEGEDRYPNAVETPIHIPAPGTPAGVPLASGNR